MYIIAGIFMPPLLQLIANTTNMSIVGFRCVGIMYNYVGEIIRESDAEINLTIIYGKCLFYAKWQYDL